MLEAWAENYPGGEGATVAAAIKLATRDPVKDEPKEDTEARGRLRDALAEIAGRPGLTHEVSAG